jgi:hypothetical protein
MNNARKYETVLCLMTSESRSLAELAELAGCDKFTFYRAADLSGIDLSGQDLRGMNLYRANLLSSNLDGVLYDPGAFNGAVLDDKLSHLADNFEFHPQDVIRHPIKEILIFCRFRPGLIDKVVDALGVSFNAFAAAAGVSDNALRKVRRGNVVAYETALNIILKIEEEEIVSDLSRSLEITNLLRQPYIDLVSGGINRPFRHVGRKRIAELSAMRGEIKEIRRELYSDQDTDTWRDTPEAIDLMINYYRQMRKTRSEW